MPDESAPRITNIDSLLDLLRQHGKLELSEIQSALGMDQRVIENWAKVLEGGGLVKLSFSAGRMYMEPIAHRPEELAIKQRQLGVKTEQLEQELSRQHAQLDKFTRMVDELGATATTIEAIFRKRMPPALEERMGDITRAQQRIEAMVKETGATRAKAETELESVKKKFSDMATKLEYFTSSKLEVNLNESIAKIDESVKKVAELRAAMDTIGKNKEKAFEDMKASVDAQLSGVNSDIIGLLNDSKQRAREYVRGADSELEQLNKSALAAHEGLHELETFRRQEGEVRRLLEELKGRFTDQYDRIFDDVKKGQSAINGAIEAQKHEFEGIRSKGSNPEHVLETISSTKAEIASAVGQLAALRDQLAQRQAEAAGLAEAISNLNERFAKLEAGVGSSLQDRSKERMAEINKAAQMIEGSSAKAEALRKATEKYFDEVNRRMTDTATKLAAINNVKAGHEVEEGMRRVVEAEAGLKGLKDAVTKAMRSHESDLNGLRNDVAAQLRDITGQIGAAKDQIEPQIRAYTAEAEDSLKALSAQAETARRSAGKLAGFKKEADSAKKTLAEAQAKYNRGYERMLAEAYKREKAMGTAAEEARRGFEELKEAMGDPAKLYDSVSRTRADITKLKGEVAKVNNELAELLHAAAEFRRMEHSKAPVDERLRKADELIGRSMDTSLKLVDINARADRAAAGITGLAGAELTMSRKGKRQKQKQAGKAKPEKADRGER